RHAPDVVARRRVDRVLLGARRRRDGGELVRREGRRLEPAAAHRRRDRRVPARVVTRRVGVLSLERREKLRHLAAARRGGARGAGAALAGGRRSVAVVLGLEGPVDAHAEVLGLLLRELRELDAELAQVERRDLLVELLRQRVDADLVLLVVTPELD